MMSGSPSEPAIPAGFLCALITDHATGSPQVHIATDRVRSSPDTSGREQLIGHLLTGPYAEEAPEWLVEAAATCDPQTVLRVPGSPYLPSLPVVALDHPSCSDGLRKKVLSECATEKLSLFGDEHVSECLAKSTAAELKRRCGTAPAMTPEMTEKPTHAQMVLRRPRLHDIVFSTALNLVPVWSPRKRDENEDQEQWHDWFIAASDAWSHMWRDVLRAQDDRHRQILDWAASSSYAADTRIRRELLGGIPWSVDPEFLVELAEHDLHRFSKAIVFAQAAQMVLSGVSIPQIEGYLSEGMVQLGERHKELMNDVLKGEEFEIEFALGGPISTAKSCVSGTWKHILDRNEIPDDRRAPHSWLAAPDTLADLCQKFAEAAVHAIPYWEGDPHEKRFGTKELRWLREILTHLPAITPDLKESVRPIIRAGESYLRRHGSSYRSHQLYQDMRRLHEDLNALRRLVDSPFVPTSSGVREFGSPDKVEVRELAELRADDLGRYLDAHRGHDALVEKALLSLAFERTSDGKSFAELLARHSQPDAALLRLTRELRTRLGGTPPLRRAWTALVLSLPEVDSEVVRALPLWSAVRCTRGRPTVVSVISQALGTDEQAWERFAANPATGTGEHAWLRLGEVLDASAAGQPWPAAPPRYYPERRDQHGDRRSDPRKS